MYSRLEVFKLSLRFFSAPEGESHAGSGSRDLTECASGSATLTYTVATLWKTLAKLSLTSFTVPVAL
jgi:hypothetical protein